jgi:hypothetical protein
MDEMDLMSQFRAAVPPPDENTLSEARARMLGSDRGSAPHRRSPHRPRGRTRFWLVPAGATAALAGLVIGAVAVSAPASPRPGTSVELTAATVLHRAAQAALAAPLPGKSQYTYTLTLGGFGRKLNSVTKQWISVDGMRPSSGFTNDCGMKGDPSCMMRLMPLQAAKFFSYTGVQKLPSASGPLLGYLAGEQAKACAIDGIRLDQSSDEWSGIFTILSDVPVLPPHFGAALFDAAAKIPGVTVIKNATTGTGERGIAVIRSVHPIRIQNTFYVKRAELIFDPHTYRYIGNSLVFGGSPPKPLTSTLITTKFIDSAPTTSERYQMILPTCVAYM